MCDFVGRVIFNTKGKKGNEGQEGVFGLQASCLMERPGSFSALFFNTENTKKGTEDTEKYSAFPV